MPKPENLNKPHRRFVLWFFAVGALVPTILVLGGLLLKLDEGRVLVGLPRTILLVLIWVIWPTWFFMFDAEHADQIAAMLAIAAPLNGLWYAVIGQLIWFIRQKRKTPLQ